MSSIDSNAMVATLASFDERLVRTEFRVRDDGACSDVVQAALRDLLHEEQAWRDGAHLPEAQLEAWWAAVEAAQRQYTALTQIESFGTETSRTDNCPF